MLNYTMSKRLMVMFTIGAVFIVVLCYIFDWGPYLFFISFLMLCMLTWKYNCEEIEEKKIEEEVKKARQLRQDMETDDNSGPGNSRI